MVIVYIILFCAVVYGVIGPLLNVLLGRSNKVDEERKHALEQTIKSRLKDKGFQADKVYVTNQHTGEGIAYDDQALSICSFNKTEEIVIHYNDIIQCEMIEDGSQITKTSRGSQVGGALIGGAVAGGVGAIIGGLSGSKTTSERVEKLQLKITVNNTIEPVQNITFLNSPVGTKKSDPIYSGHFLKEARYWHGLVSVLIKRADDESIQFVQNVDSPVESESVADELLKLAQLHKDGLLTKEEFDAQKLKLLA